MKKQPPQIKDYYKKIEAEIGHFVHHLLNGVEIQYPSEHRLYFDPKDYANEAKAFLKDLAKTDLHSAIECIVSSWFEKHPDQLECYFDLKSIKNELKLYYKANGFKQDFGDKELKISMKKDFDSERSTKVTRPDSLAFLETIKGVPSDNPERKSLWWCLERSEIMGEDSIFDSSKIMAM